MVMVRRRGAWSQITNISDRDTAISLLRSAGHGKALDRNVDMILYSKVKIDMHGNIVELSLGKHGPWLFRQQVTAADDDDSDLYWDLSESVGKLKHLHKLELYCCRSLPITLDQLPELKSLVLRFCDGQAISQTQREIIDSSERTNWIYDNLKNACSCLRKLTMLEIHGGIWDEQSILWLKSMTACDCTDVEAYEDNEEQSFSRLEIVRFLSLDNNLQDAILDFLLPFTTNGLKNNRSDREGNKRIGRICKLPTSKLKHLTWTHSGITDECLERLLWGVVLPHHPNLSSIDVSGNRIRSIQFLFERCGKGMYPSILMGDMWTTGSKDSSEDIDRQKRHDEIFYHPLRVLNLEHNPVLRHRISNDREIDAFELLLRHCFPLLGSLTPSWESWDARIEYVLRINRGGRVLVEGNSMPAALLTLKRLTSSSIEKVGGNKKTLVKETILSEKLARNKIPLAVWPLVLHRAYKTSASGFLSHAQDATAIYYMIRNGSALSEIFASTKT